MTTDDPNFFTPGVLVALAIAAAFCGLYGWIKGHGFIVPALLGFACFPLAALVILLKEPGTHKRPGTPKSPRPRSTPGDGGGNANGGSIRD